MQVLQQFCLKSFFDYVDNQTTNPLTASLSIILFYVTILYSYLFIKNRVRSHLSKVKTEKDFIDIGFDSLLLAMIEQASFMVYFREAFNLLLHDKIVIRFITCVLFSLTHVLSFNNWNDTFILFLQLSTTFSLSLVYTKMLPLYSFLLHSINNTLGVVITFALYKLIIKRNLFQGKIYFAPINVENIPDGVKTE